MKLAGLLIGRFCIAYLFCFVLVICDFFDVVECVGADWVDWGGGGFFDAVKCVGADWVDWVCFGFFDAVKCVGTGGGGGSGGGAI